MALDLQQELKQAHALLDQLPPAKLGAVRSLLAVMVDDDEEEALTEADRRAIQVGLDSLEKHGTVSMEEVLADFGLTTADFEKMADEPDPLPTAKLNG
jgi:hypothetical protein